jgi:hypothetical protein
MSSKPVSRRRFLSAAGAVGAAAMLRPSDGAVAQSRTKGITGTVVDLKSSPIIGARVTLSRPVATALREVRTDASGRYVIPDISEGRYWLGASAPGIEYKEVDLVVDQPSKRSIEVNFSLGPDTHPGRWEILGNPGEALGGTNSGALLPDGRIMYCHDTVTPVVFDPVTTNRERAPTSGKLQGCHAVTLMPDGRLIYVGGTEVPDYGPGTRRVKTYDPIQRRWQILNDLTVPRWYPTLVPLPDGDLLVVGGGGVNNPARVATSEVMNARDMSWSAAGNIAIGNEVSPVVLLYSGRVLMTHRPPQLYDPTTRQWHLAADFVQGNRMANGDHSDHEILLLPDGRVVAVGFKSFTRGKPGNLVEIYDAARNVWSLGANYAPVRSRASIVLQPDGRVLVMGGFKEEPGDPTPTNRWGQVRLTDLYDMKSDSWRRLADMNFAREYHATPLLVADGRVIIAGGEGQPGNPPARSQVEAFSPPYLFRGPRPEISNFTQTNLKRGDRVTFTVAGTRAATQVILTGMSARTHFMDSGNARYLELTFTQTDDKLTAHIPSDRTRAVFGYYLLFVLVDGIPSVGKIVRITG